MRRCCRCCCCCCCCWCYCTRRQHNIITIIWCWDLAPDQQACPAGRHCLASNTSLVCRTWSARDRSPKFHLLRSDLSLAAEATARQYCFSIIANFFWFFFSLVLFPVSTITDEPLHLTWWNFEWTCILTTSRTQLNFKVKGQGHISFLCFFVCMILADST